MIDSIIIWTINPMVIIFSTWQLIRTDDMLWLMPIFASILALIITIASYVLPKE